MPKNEALALSRGFRAIARANAANKDGTAIAMEADFKELLTRNDVNNS